MEIKEKSFGVEPEITVKLAKKKVCFLRGSLFLTEEGPYEGKQNYLKRQLL